LELNAATASRGTTLSADVCVVGAGPVGLALAETLRSRGVQVALLESGGHTPAARTRELNAAELSGDPYGDLRDTRARAIGGTASMWNTIVCGVEMAKYVALDPQDFEERPWVPHSGWPFGRDELDPYYARAHQICGLGPYREDPQPDDGDHPLLSLEASGLRNDVYRFGPASRFTLDIPERLRAAADAILARGATVVELVVDRGRGRVLEARWRTLDGCPGVARASSFVLAAGGIENARLLLSARERLAPGAPAGWLGAGFTEHPIDSSLELTSRAPALAPPGGFYAPHEAAGMEMLMGRIALTSELLRNEALPNASVRLAYQPDPPALRAGPLRRAARTMVPTARLRRTIGNAVRGIRKSSARVVGATYRVLVDLEQLPSKDNRVSLSGRDDALGLRTARLHWRWTARDEANRRRTLDVIRGALERSGVGRVRETVPSLDPAAHHHCGTTRMGTDPSTSVVDAGLRVHETENLYVVGSSVFPAAGFANPTLTAIALAIRLADQLDGDGRR
jgi:choline dehydrogenase-like flavoprotein